MESATPHEYLRKPESLEDRMKKIQSDGEDGKIEAIEQVMAFKMVPMVQLGEIVPVYKRY